MAHKPILSVITTVYNCDNFLNKSIDSVLGQTFSDFELIIVNDGSTDNTDIICDSYLSDSRVRYVNNKDNKKIPTRRNEAIDIASGKYVAIHDGDDISFLDRFEKQVEFMEANEEIFCVGGFARKIDKNGVEGDLMAYPPPNNDDIIRETLSKMINPIIDPTSMFRASIFKSLGGYTTNQILYTVPDFHLWTRAMLSGYKFANLQEPLIYYRINPNGMTVRHKPEMIRAFVKVWHQFKVNYGKISLINKA